MTHISKLDALPMPGASETLVPDAALSSQQPIQQASTVDNWIAGNGKWSLATDWSTGVPTATSAVVLSSAGGGTITLGSAPYAAYSLVSTTDTLNMVSGSLTVTNGATFGAALILAATTLTLDAASSMSGGVTLNGHGTLSLASGVTDTVSGALTLNSGLLVGPGTLATSGTTTINNAGNSFYFGQGANWTNTGVVNDGGKTELGIPVGKTADTSTVTITNAAGGVFNLTNTSAGMVYSTPATPVNATLINAGLLADTNASGTTDLQLAVTNSGTISLSTGVLQLDGRLTNTGTIALGAGLLKLEGGGALGSFATASGTLDLAGGSFTDSASGLSGAANLLIGGTLGLSSAGGALTGAVTLLNGGTLVLGAGVSASATALTGSGGAVAGAGTLTTGGTTSVTAAATPGLSLGDGLTWLNTGTVNDAGLIDLGIASGLNPDTSTITLSNAAGAVMNFTAAGAGFAFGTVATGFAANLTNAGTLLDSAAGVVGVQAAVANTASGVIAVTGGTLQLLNGINNSGVLQIGTSTLDIYGGGTLGTFSNATGTLYLGSGTFSAGNVILSRVANLQIGGTLSLTSGGALSDNVSLDGGALTLAAGTKITLANGLIDNGGTLYGSGTLLTSAPTTINYGSGGLFVGNGATWINTSTITASDYLNFGLYNNGSYDSSTVTFNNMAGAVYDIVSNVAIHKFYATSSFQPVFNNAGLLEKTAGAGTSNINIAVVNTGTIAVSTGTLELSAGGALGGVTAGAGTLELGAATFSASISNLVGVANLEIGGATLDLNAVSGAFSNNVAINNGATLVLASATTTKFTTSLVDNGGTIAGPGTFVTTGPTTILSGDGGMAIGNGVNWNNTSTVLLADALNFGGTYNGAADTSTVTLTNEPAGIFDFTTDVGIGFAATGAGFAAVFNNSGTLEKTGGIGTSDVLVTVDSTGTISSSSGVLQLGGGGMLGGVIGASGTAGAVLLSNNGSFTASGLTIADNGANVALLIGSGTTLTNAGTTTLNGELAIGNNAAGVAGFVNQTGALLVLGSADAAVVNSGSFTFANEGIIRDSFNGVLALSDRMSNVGTIDVAAGTLQLSNVNGSGGLLIEAGATLEIVSNVFSTQNYGFNGPGATLKQDTPASIKTPIVGLGPGARIDLVGSVATSATAKGNTLTVVTNTGTYQYASAAPIGGDTATIVSDGNGGSIVSVYGSAVATISPQPLSFGNLHVGDTGTVTLSVTNSAVANGYSETLDAQVAGVSSGIASTGSISMLAAGGTSTAIGFSASTAAAGAIAGSGTLALQSDGTGIDGGGATALPSQALSFTGGVYRYAAPSAVTPLNFGVVHVGDAVSQALSLSNTDPADGYSEALDAFLMASAGITASGSISMLAAGGTDSSSLLLGLFTGSSGVVGGTATLGLLSDGNGIDGLGTTVLANQYIGVSGTIDNYATAGFVDAGGPAITTAGANSFALNLGSVAAGGTLAVTLGADNSAAGLADLLGGTLFTTGGAGFTDNGFGAFSGLAAGQSELGQSITLSSANAGVFTETITLTASGSNSSGYSGAVPTEILTITGTVISAATTYTLTAAGTTIVGAPGVDIFVATGGVLTSKDNLTGSNSGQNVMQFSGGGTFDLSSLGTFANIQTIQASEGQAGSGTLPRTTQTVYLRAGTSETVNVADGVPAQGNPGRETIVIHGAANNDVINLASGSDTVYLGGSGETVNGTDGTYTFYASTGGIGATINGGSGRSSLILTGGGVFNLGSTITNVSTLALQAASTAYNVTANSLASLVIVGSGAADTITLGAKGQSVNANGGAVHVNTIAKYAVDKITGAAGAVLEISTAGKETLNRADSNLTVVLDAANSLTLNKATFISATAKVAGATITAADTQQTLSSLAGGDALIGYTQFGDTFTGSSAGLNGDSITNFGGSDVIDVNDLVFGTLNDSYSGNATQGTLTLSDGTHNLTITMVGSYTLGSFHFGSDGHSGTDITFI